MTPDELKRVEDIKKEPWVNDGTVFLLDLVHRQDEQIKRLREALESIAFQLDKNSFLSKLDLVEEANKALKGEGGEK